MKARFPVCVVLLLISALKTPSAQQAHDSLHAWVGAKDPAALQSWINERLAAEKQDLDKMLAVKESRTIENTLRPFDDAQNELAIAANNAFLLYSLADTAPMRDMGQKMSEVVAAANTDLALNQQVYRALAAIPLPDNDPATRHYLEHTLLEYHLAGVDKDEETRKKIHALQDKIINLSLAFGRNLAEGTLRISATRAELDGLPDDYILRHKPNVDGTYILTTDSPDANPVLDFGADAGLRLRMYQAYHGRAYPRNDQVLRELLIARQDLATTLGYDHYADLATADQMIGSAANVQKLIDQVNAVSHPAARREYEDLLAFAQRRQPDLKTITIADYRYWMEQYRRANLNFNAQSVRPYFPYAQVQTGILDTATRLFHVSFKPVKDAVVWDSSVDTFDVFDETTKPGKLIGRIYLDMHPRDGKDKWFSSSPVVPGIRGRQHPEGMLVCNFSGGVGGDPGLMQYDEVVTFFHEFGHLMHNLLGSQGQWAGQGGFNVEGDFVEAPSQMLEEIFHSPTILQSFGKDYKTGTPIPAELVDRMNAGSAYGRARWLQNQLLYSSFSLQVHNQSPDKIDFDGLYREDQAKFTDFSPVLGDHFSASFTHITSYASNYYTYVLDKVIAIDFFSQFDKNNLLEGPTAMRYRRSVLEPGSTKPAADLVKDFLGRPQNITALEKWMNEEFDAKPAPTVPRQQTASTPQRAE